MLVEAQPLGSRDPLGGGDSAPSQASVGSLCTLPQVQVRVLETEGDVKGHDLQVPRPLGTEVAWSEHQGSI